jgi:hypothetical protein
VHAEQQALGGGLMADVGDGVVIGRQRVAFLVVQAVAVGAHAGNEDIAGQAVTEKPHGGLDLLGGGAAFPVVHVVEDDVEAARGKGFVHGVGIVAVGQDVVHPPAEIMFRLAMQHGNFVLPLQQLFHQRPPDEEGSTDNQYLHILLRQ